MIFLTAADIMVKTHEDVKEMILNRIEALIKAYRAGELGGAMMPEDENPALEPQSNVNYMYFTLPMALNHQRNSYALWACANRMFKDHPELFNSSSVCVMDEKLVRDILVQYKVALQPNKQPIIWQTLCRTIENELSGDIRNLFRWNDNSVSRIKAYIADHKKSFPYLGGNKICNYWLYVMEQYTDVSYSDRENITVAPDTHVIQASLRLGVVSKQEASCSNIQQITAERWKELLKDTDLKPIDVHTPLWLWSHGKFRVNI